MLGLDCIYLPTSRSNRWAITVYYSVLEKNSSKHWKDHVMSIYWQQIYL